MGLRRGALMPDTYDVIVIGAGPVGENVADRAVAGGLTAVIVEAELVGGECSYWACMPSKALLTPIMALDAARAVAGAAEAVTGELDIAAVLKRRNSFAGHWKDDGQVSWLNGVGIDLVRGHGRITGTRRVSVTAAAGEVTELVARQAVAISTGTTATVPNIPGLSGSAPWTSREATSAQHIPTSLAILGGGVVATEMATAYAALGASVTMLVRSRLLGGLESFAGEMVAQRLRAGGVDVRFGVTPTRVDRSEGVTTIVLDSGDELQVAQFLVATGRTPATGDLGLDSIGLTPGGYLAVDDTMRVTDIDGGWLYAVGDVNGRVLLTHQGKYQARAAGDVIAARAAGGEIDDAPWGRHAATADHRSVPSVVFSQPEVASVGLTLAKAEKEFAAVRAVDYDLGKVAGAGLHADGYQGRVRIVVDTDREVIVGATFVGAEVGEMLHAATIAVVGEVPIKRLWHAVPSYPTMSEVWLRLLETFGR